MLNYWKQHNIPKFDATPSQLNFKLADARTWAPTNSLILEYFSTFLTESSMSSLSVPLLLISLPLMQSL